jgi:hypothetical protein
MANVSNERHRSFVKFLRRFFSSVLAVGHGLCESHAVGDEARVLFAAAGVPLQGALKQHLPARSLQMTNGERRLFKQIETRILKG